MAYSPRGIFLGLSQSELDELRANALLAIKSGRRTSISGGAKSGSKDYPMLPQDILDEVTYAEGVLNRTGRAQKVYQTMNDQFAHRRTE